MNPAALRSKWFASVIISTLVLVLIQDTSLGFVAADFGFWGWANAGSDAMLLWFVARSIWRDRA